MMAFAAGGQSVTQPGRPGFDIVEGSNIAACHIFRMIRCTEWNFYRRNRGIFGDSLPLGRGSCELLALVDDALQLFQVKLEHGSSLTRSSIVPPGVNLCFAHNTWSRMHVLLFYGRRRRIATVFLNLCHRHSGLHDLAPAAQRIGV